jgi:hypothetical protein
MIENGNYVVTPSHKSPYITIYKGGFEIEIKVYEEAIEISNKEFKKLEKRLKKELKQLEKKGELHEI